MSEQSEVTARDRQYNEESLQEKEEPPSSGFLHVHVKLWRETRVLGRDAWMALKLIVILLILCGVVFPFIVFVVGQLAFPYQANGSLLRDKQGNPIGSRLLGQQFTRAEYFHGRPSAAGYDASNSSGSKCTKQARAERVPTRLGPKKDITSIRPITTRSSSTSSFSSIYDTVTAAASISTIIASII